MNANEIKQRADFDRAHIWHPAAQMKDYARGILLDKGKQALFFVVAQGVGRKPCLLDDIAYRVSHDRQDTYFFVQILELEPTLNKIFQLFSQKLNT